jgi:hypothetical protein
LGVSCFTWHWRIWRGLGGFCGKRFRAVSTLNLATLHSLDAQSHSNDIKVVSTLMNQKGQQDYYTYAYFTIRSDRLNYLYNSFVIQPSITNPKQIQVDGGGPHPCAAHELLKATLLFQFRFHLPSFAVSAISTLFSIKLIRSLFFGIIKI